MTKAGRALERFARRAVAHVHALDPGKLPSRPRKPRKARLPAAPC